MKASRVLVIGCMVAVGFVALATVGVGPVLDVFDDPEPTEMPGYEPGTSTEYSQTDYMSQPMIGESEAALPVIAIGTASLIGGYIYGEYSNDFFESSADSELSAAFSADSARETLIRVNKRMNVTNDRVETVAYTEAEAAFAQTLANNESIAKAQENAVTAVRDYIADAQENEIIVRNNEYVESWDRIMTQSGVSGYPSSGSVGDSDYAGTSSRQVQLVDGSEVQLDEVDFVNTGVVGSTGQLSFLSPNDGIKLDFDDSGLDSRILVKKSTLDGMQERFNELENIEDQVTDDIGAFSSNVSESQFSDLDPSDVVSPVTAATQFDTAFESTENPEFAAALMENLGFDTSGLGTSVTVEINGTNRTGVIFADPGQFANDTINVSESFSDSDNIAAWLNTGNRTFDLSDVNWTVTEISTEDGTMSRIILDDAAEADLDPQNPSERAERNQELLERLGLSSSIGGGLFGGEGGPLGIPWLVWILGGGAILLLVARRD
jgi:hypothetical protein